MFFFWKKRVRGHSPLLFASRFTKRSPQLTEGLRNFFFHFFLKFGSVHCGKCNHFQEILLLVRFRMFSVQVWLCWLTSSLGLSSGVETFRHCQFWVYLLNNSWILLNNSWILNHSGFTLLLDTRMHFSKTWSYCVCKKS